MDRPKVEKTADRLVLNLVDWKVGEKVSKMVASKGGEMVD